MFGISRYRQHAIYGMISIRYDMYLVLYTHEDYEKKSRTRYVFVRAEIKAWNKSISIRIDRRKRLAAWLVRMMLVGCMNAHQFDAKGRQGRKPISEGGFFATKTKASRVMSKGQCVPHDPEYELRKGGSLTTSCAENTRGWDRKNNGSSMHECISCTFWCVY